MPSPIAFVATLFIGAACCLFSGAMALPDHLAYTRGGVPATMVGDDPRIALEARTGAPGWVRARVKYLTADGEVVVPDKGLGADELARLAAGDGIPVVFLRDNPQVAYADGRAPMNPWGWLVVGALLLPTALYARRLLLREAAAKARR